MQEAGSISSRQARPVMVRSVPAVAGAPAALCRVGKYSQMLALVRVALTRPYTFVVLALLILIVGPLAALRPPVDIFPEIRIPVIAVVWQYTGLPPDQMPGRVMLCRQRSSTTPVNDIEHIEGTSYT